MSTAAGFAVKSGWAAAVLLRLEAGRPVVVDSRRVLLCDPAVPESRQPYHDGFGTARARDASLDALLASVREHGRRSTVAALAGMHHAAAFTRVAIVAGSLADPETIANDHIRIHALEGRLFRDVVAAAATSEGLSCVTWRERDLPAMVSGALRLPLEDARAALAAAARGRAPWRAEQKAAALAAWLAAAGAS